MLNIKIIFKIIGAAAATANLLLEFKMPEKKMINLQIIKRKCNSCKLYSKIELNIIGNETWGDQID